MLGGLRHMNEEYNLRDKEVAYDDVEKVR
jgi:hypothetical protein